MATKPKSMDQIRSLLQQKANFPFASLTTTRKRLLMPLITCNLYRYLQQDIGSVSAIDLGACAKAKKKKLMKNFKSKFSGGQELTRFSRWVIGWDCSMAFVPVDSPFPLFQIDRFSFEYSGEGRFSPECCLESSWRGLLRHDRALF
ncbi:hypothetical protein [Natronogracilivirga saccharolytica]|uniref:hypothetical protein n=1 Tax=Natronogracilivirga saccharolytica TaxID=2812953 RepID=UPI001B30A9DA|nr:hypothetical protein [Natronogracilivirga saccharolytica]